MYLTACTTWFPFCVASTISLSFCLLVASTRAVEPSEGKGRFSGIAICSINFNFNLKFTPFAGLRQRLFVDADALWISCRKWSVSIFWEHNVKFHWIMELLLQIKHLLAFNVPTYPTYISRISSRVMNFELRVVSYHQSDKSKIKINSYGFPDFNFYKSK